MKNVLQGLDLRSAPGFSKVLTGKFLTSLVLGCCFLLATLTANSQVLISGTSFEPTAGNGGRYYIGMDDIQQYGVYPGEIQATIPLAPNVDPGNFHPDHQYAIVDNPYKVDTARYLDTTKDYQMVVSPPSTEGRFLEYSVNGLRPGSQVRVEVDYCTVMDLTRSDNSSCDPWNVVNHAGSINPDSPGPYAGENSNSIDQGGVCSTYTWQSDGTNNLSHVDGQGNAQFNLKAIRTGDCRAFSIKEINIYGYPKPDAIATTGDDVCLKEDIKLDVSQNFSGSFEWQLMDGGTWTTVGTNKSILYQADDSRTYEFRVAYTTSGGDGPFYSDTVSVVSDTCCMQGGEPVSRSTIFYDDFGRVIDSNQFEVWDYSNIRTPHLDTISADGTNGYRRRLATDPPGSTYQGGGGPLNTGDYTVAGYIIDGTWNGMEGADLDWAGRTTGPCNDNKDFYGDHSDDPGGAAFMYNIPPDDSGEVVYERSIDGLCSGKELTFEAFVTVFTTSAGGTYNPIDLKMRLEDPSTGTVVTDNVLDANCDTDGDAEWKRVSGKITLGGNTLNMQLVNQEPSESGNDLMLDDIKITGCSPPQVNAYFDTTTLSTETTICVDEPLSMFTDTTSLINSYFDNTADDPKFLWQWSTTPNDTTSWTNLGSGLQDSLSFKINDPEGHAVFPDSNDTYFRVIVANEVVFNNKNNFDGSNGYAVQNDPCKNYSVSDPIRASINCPQPVDMLAFDGSTHGEANRLSWRTANEKNNDYFVVQRSSNGESFESIGRIEGSGSTSKQQLYTFMDEEPLKTSYYRLKQVDYDGSYEYSKVISVARSGLEQAFTVYPNPNKGAFTAQLENYEAVSGRLEIVDVHGQTVFSRTMDKEKVKVNGLDNGFYIVRLYTANEVITRKLVVR